jgi:hypothetical protein
MSTPIEHNEPIKPNQAEQVGTAAGARLGAEYAANMSAPKAESAGPGSADKHLTNLQLTDGDGKELQKRKASEESAIHSTGDKMGPNGKDGSGNKYGDVGQTIGDAYGKHVDARPDNGKNAIVGAVIGGALGAETGLMVGAGPVVGATLGAAAGYEVAQVLQHR